MASSRIDGERLDVILDRLAQRPGRPAARPQAERSPNVKRPQRTEPAGIELTAPPDFASIVEEVAARPRPASTAGSLHQVIVDFVMPRLTDATVLHGSRAASILEHLVSDVLPNLAGGDELRRLARTIITDELARHHDKLARSHSGIAA